jgi:hypothetical protein
MPTPNPLEKKKDAQSAKNLPRKQRLAVIFLALGAILIVVFWAVQLSARLNKPFSAGKTTNSDNQATNTNSNLKDSDGDGLSDYEEINVYYTSPYLEDSDSDGILDKQEIAQETDPNCPTGKDCSNIETTDSATINSAADDVNGSVDPELLLTNNETVGTTITSDEVTPEILRQILLQNGYDQATLDKISDEDIMKSYQEAVASQGN